MFRQSFLRQHQRLQDVLDRDSWMLERPCLAMRVEFMDWEAQQESPPPLLVPMPLLRHLWRKEHQVE